MLQLYAVFDKKSSSYFPPFHVKHVAEALRSITMLLDPTKPSDSPIVKWPEDFALYLIGTFDPTTGGITPTASGQPQFTMELAALRPIALQPKEVSHG